MAVAAPTAPAFSLRGVVKSFGGRRILDGADLELGPRARVGLIGANGTGKSTLLAMLAGEEGPDAGSVTLRKGAVVAYLHQIVDGEQRTVREVLAAARPERAALQDELARVEAQLADPALAGDLGRMSRVLERQAALVERLSGDTASGDAIRHVRDLGLAEDELDRPTHALSGGQRKLVALAA